MEPQEKPKKPRTEAQKAATAKAIAALRARRKIAQDVIEGDMQKQVEEAEERIAARVMSRMGVIKSEEVDTPEVKKAVKKASEVVEKKKKVVVVEESESSSEEEVIIKKVKKTKTAPEPVAEVKKDIPQLSARTTGNKLLDKMYGFI